MTIAKNKNCFGNKFHYTFQRLNLESVQQNADSSKFLPLSVNVPKDNSQPSEGQALQYSQFLQITKQQINCAKEVHDLLLKFSKKVTDR